MTVASCVLDASGASHRWLGKNVTSRRFATGTSSGALGRAADTRQTVTGLLTIFLTSFLTMLFLSNKGYVHDVFL